MITQLQEWMLYRALDRAWWRGLWAGLILGVLITLGVQALLRG